MLERYSKADLIELAHLASIDHFKFTIPELGAMVENLQLFLEETAANFLAPQNLT
jgi:hypothetical protein